MLFKHKIKIFSLVSFFFSLLLVFPIHAAGKANITIINPFNVRIIVDASMSCSMGSIQGLGPSYSKLFQPKEPITFQVTTTKDNSIECTVYFASWDPPRSQGELILMIPNKYNGPNLIPYHGDGLYFNLKLDKEYWNGEGEIEVNGALS